MQRNETVTIIYEVPGIVLTMRGKALEAGAHGDIINVLNIQSKRTVQAPSSAPAASPSRAAAPLVAAAAAPVRRQHDQAPQHRSERS